MPDLSGLSDAELYAYAAKLQAFHDPASMARWLNPAYQIRSHHRLIGEKIAGFLKRGSKRKLMVLAPPRSGKSELVTKMLPLWWLAHHPHHQVVAAAYGSESSSDRPKMLASTFSICVVVLARSTYNGVPRRSASAMRRGRLR